MIDHLKCENTRVTQLLKGKDQLIKQKDEEI